MSTLVISRERDQGILIGDDIVITVVHISGDKVRLAISVPPDVPVLRGEVYELINGPMGRADEERPDAGQL